MERRDMTRKERASDMKRAKGEEEEWKRTGDVERSRRVGLNHRSEGGGLVVRSNEVSGVLPVELDGVTGNRDGVSVVGDRRTSLKEMERYGRVESVEGSDK
jgi:hypothetical protein